MKAVQFFFILNAAAWPLQNNDDRMIPDPDEEQIYFQASDLQVCVQTNF